MIKLISWNFRKDIKEYEKCSRFTTIYIFSSCLKNQFYGRKIKNKKFLLEEFPGLEISEGDIVYEIFDKYNYLRGESWMKLSDYTTKLLILGKEKMITKDDNSQT